MSTYAKKCNCRSGILLHLLPKAASARGYRSVFAGALKSKRKPCTLCTMKRLIPACFIAVIALLAVVYFSRHLFVAETDVTRARVVVPVVDSEADSGDGADKGYNDAYDMDSFITLATGETLIGTVTMDVDADGYDDQINVIKTVSNPYLVLVIAIYNPATARYDRSLSLPTTITQVRSFVCTGMDVIGNHRSSIIYQGVSENGHSLLQIYNGYRTESGSLGLNLIGDFEADGTVFIQQLDRDESYELSRARGSSFPVWVYTSEPRAGSTVYDQVQTMYDWSEAEQQYVKKSQKRIAGSRLAEKELERIQDGTVATFGKFLDGLWYKTENSSDGIRYIFFDYGNSELIFQHGDSEEVYSWQNSNLRRGGMYFSSVNKSIESLQRRVDISLVSVSEIRVRIQDDVRMIIGESTLWDGNYRKMTTVMRAETPAVTEAVQALIVGSRYVTGDGLKITFDDVSYAATGPGFADSGRYMRFVVSGTTLLQFKSDTVTPFFTGSYEADFAQARHADNGAKDKKTVLLYAVSVTPEGFYRKDTTPITLHLVE